MPVYNYKCLDSSGKTIKGTRDADSEKSLRLLLRKDGLFLQEAKAAKDKGSGMHKEVEISFLNKISVIDVALVTRQMATLLKASVPLTETLAAISEQLGSDKKRKKLGTIVSQIKLRINEGLSLAESLKEHPKVFNDFYISMVRSGEAAGNLDEVLFSLTDFLEKQHKIKSKIKGAMTYPIVMICITVVVIGILMTSVIPNVISVFEDTDQTLPWYTQFLIDSSDYFANYWFHTIVVLIASWIFFGKWKKTKNGRKRWDRIILNTPLVGSLVRRVAISRFSGTLGIMLKSGVPILKCLDIVKSVMGNVILREVISDVESSIKEGKTIASVLSDSGEFPPMATHMIAIGEKSGQLEEMLNNVAATYDTEVDNAITALTSMLEPMMIVIMGGIVAFVVFSILMPIMQMNNLGM
jgi:type II secretion system protein F